MKQLNEIRKEAIQLIRELGNDGIAQLSLTPFGAEWAPLWAIYNSDEVIDLDDLARKTVDLIKRYKAATEAK